MSTRASREPFSIPEPEALFADRSTIASAQEWLFDFRVGMIDRSRVNPLMNGLLADGNLHEISAALAKLGACKSLYLFEKKSLANATAYLFRVAFATAPHTMMMKEDDHLKQLSGFAVRKSRSQIVCNIQVDSNDVF